MIGLHGELSAVNLARKEAEIKFARRFAQAEASGNLRSEARARAAVDAYVKRASKVTPAHKQNQQRQMLRRLARREESIPEPRLHQRAERFVRSLRGAFGPGVELFIPTRIMEAAA